MKLIHEIAIFLFIGSIVTIPYSAIALVWTESEVFLKMMMTAVIAFVPLLVLIEVTE